MSTRVDALGSALRGRFGRRLRTGFASRSMEPVDSLVATALKYLNGRSISISTNDYFRNASRPLQALEAHLRRTRRDPLDGRAGRRGTEARLQAEAEFVRSRRRHRARRCDSAH